mgnify:CR=1 FL=1
MIISSANDYRAAARRRVPPFMFHYADGGSYTEYTLARNVSDLSEIALRQRVLNDMSQLNTEIELFGEKLSMKCRRQKRQRQKGCRLRCQPCPFVLLKKLLRQLIVQCGSSYMCSKIAVL